MVFFRRNPEARFQKLERKLDLRRNSVSACGRAADAIAEIGGAKAVALFVSALESTYKPLSQVYFSTEDQRREFVEQGELRRRILRALLTLGECHSVIAILNKDLAGVLQTLASRERSTLHYGADRYHAPEDAVAEVRARRSCGPIADALLAFIQKEGSLFADDLLAWIARGFPMLPAVILAAEVPVETTYLIVSGKTFDPVWFDIMAAGSLVVGILLGAYCHVVFGSGSGSKLGMCPRTT